MGKLENEVKVLDINPNAFAEKVLALGGTVKSTSLQKIYVYDFDTVYSRFYDVMRELGSSRGSIAFNIAKQKLRRILFEVDNLTKPEDQETLLQKCGHRYLIDYIERFKDEHLYQAALQPEIFETVSNYGAVNPNRWVRLRETNGKTTVTIKHILNAETIRNAKPSSLDGLVDDSIIESVRAGNQNQIVNETESLVAPISGDTPIESANEMLTELGFMHRNYQEKKRTSFVLDGKQIDLDEWPLIAPYIEIEDESNDAILALIRRLGLQDHERVSSNVEDLYKRRGIDIKTIRELRFSSKKLPMIEEVEEERG